VVTNVLTAGPAWLTRGRVPCLDGLRAVSILLVLLDHGSLTHGFPIRQDDLRLSVLGYVGVSMFFAISGFLITLLLIREWDRTGEISLRGFYWRRALRILPAYVTFLLVIFVLTRTTAVTMTRADWIGVSTYTVNFMRVPTWDIGHLWSLSVEEQFYLVWPALLLVVRPARAHVVVIGYLLAALGLRLAMWAFFRSHLHLIEDLTPLRLDAIAAGCLLALLSVRSGFRDRLAVVRHYPALFASIGAAVVAASTILGRYIGAYQVTLSYSIEALAMCLVIWAMAQGAHTAAGRLLESRPAVFVGLLSYSLYLWQQLFLNPHRDQWTATWPINVALAVGTALVSYYLVESPFLRIKDRAATTRRTSSADRAKPHKVASLPLG